MSVWNRDTNAVTDIVRDVKGVSGTSWSPTGRWIAFGGNPGGRGDGVWLVDPEGKHLTRVSTHPNVSSITWSPDGRHLIYATSDPATTLHRIDLTPQGS